MAKICPLGVLGGISNRGSKVPHGQLQIRFGQTTTTTNCLQAQSISNTVNALIGNPTHTSHSSGSGSQLPSLIYLVKRRTFWPDNISHYTEWASFNPEYIHGRWIPRLLSWRSLGVSNVRRRLLMSKPKPADLASRFSNPRSKDNLSPIWRGRTAMRPQTISGRTFSRSRRCPCWMQS